MRNGVVLFGIFLVLAGCAGVRDPIVVVSDVRITDRSDEALRLDFTLDLDNPNTDISEGLRLSEFDYDVSINGTRAFTGVWAAQATLAPGDHRQLTIPAVVRYDAMGWDKQQIPATIRFSINGSLTYIAPGELSRTFREMGFPPPSAPFNRDAEMSLIE